MDTEKFRRLKEIVECNHKLEVKLGGRNKWVQCINCKHSSTAWRNSSDAYAEFYNSITEKKKEYERGSV